MEGLLFKKTKEIFCKNLSQKGKSPINEGCIIISYKAPDEL